MTNILIHLVQNVEFEKAQAFYTSVGYQQTIQENDIVLSAIENHAIVGLVRLATEDGALVLRGMMIAPSHQRRGVGAAMLKELERHIGEADCYCLPHEWLEHFYGLIGFQKINEASGPQHLRDRLRESLIRYPKLIMMKRTSHAVTG